jgi:prepilin-type N-terminal cleavage/methylation domain-containing protein
MRSKHHSGPRRAGFTLVELLIVLMIIVVLVGLLAAAVVRFSPIGPRLATQANLNKSRDYLQTQFTAVRSQLQNEQMTANAVNKDYLTQAQAAYSGAPPNDPRVRQEYMRLKLIQAFPTSFSEVFQPLGAATQAQDTWQFYVNYLAQAGVTAGNSAAWASTPRATQQAICAYMILQGGPKNIGLTADDLGTGAVGSLSVLNTTLQGLVDGWGRPVAFTRTYDWSPSGSNPSGTMSPALLSAGKDGLFGVYDVSLTVNAPPAGGNLLGPVPPQSSDPIASPAVCVYSTPSSKQPDQPSDNILGYTP